MWLQSFLLLSGLHHWSKTFILLSSSCFIHLLSTHSLTSSSSPTPLCIKLCFFLIYCDIGVFTQVSILFSSYGLMRNLSFLSLSRVKGLFTGYYDNSAMCEWVCVQVKKEKKREKIPNLRCFTNHKCGVNFFSGIMLLLWFVFSQEIMI